MIPMVKNITSKNIDVVDENDDMKITPEEIQLFWNKSHGLPISPDKNIITKYIIETIFPNGLNKINKDEFVNILNGLPSANVKTITIEEGIMG